MVLEHAEKKPPGRLCQRKACFIQRGQGHWYPRKGNELGPYGGVSLIGAIVSRARGRKFIKSYRSTVWDVTSNQFLPGDVCFYLHQAHPVSGSLPAGSSWKRWGSSKTPAALRMRKSRFLGMLTPLSFRPVPQPSRHQGAFMWLPFSLF